MDVPIDEDWYEAWETDAGVYKLILQPIYCEVTEGDKESTRNLSHFNINEVEILFRL